MKISRKSGMYEVSIKGLNCHFFVIDWREAMEIAWRLGVKNA